jgi:hypothetical protein
MNLYELNKASKYNSHSSILQTISGLQPLPPAGVLLISLSGKK